MRSPASSPRVSSSLLVGTLALLAACGGGGSGGGGIAEPPPPGLAGTVRAEDFDLGRMVEHEPNDTRAQFHRLPPIAARARMGVTGTAEAGVDATDVFGVVFLSTQDVSLTLGWVEPAGAADLGLEVFEAGGVVALAEAAPGASPQTAGFTAVQGRLYQVVVTASTGRAAWTLAIEASDPAGALAQPSSLRLPDAAPPDDLPEVGACAPGHVLVGLRPGGIAERLAERFGLAVGERVGERALRLRLPEPVRDRRTARIRAWCERLREDPDVLFAEPDWVVRPLGTTNDAELSRQWNLEAIGAPAAWGITRGDPAVLIGIVDTGIRSHPDLEGRVAPGGYDFISDPGISGDGTGRDPDPTDPGAREYPSGRSQWHGTHVAGIAVARADDGEGIAGVAPDCRVVPLRAIGRTGGYVSDVADAILYGAGLLTTADGRRLTTPVRVLNLSFGLEVDSTVLRNACDFATNAGVLLVGATGNDGGSVLYPAAYPSVLAVGAIDASLDTLGYSNFGTEVDLAAPGGDLGTDARLDGWPDAILSCLYDETVHPMRAAHGYLEGTSQAAPHVAAAAALLFSVDPTLTPAEAKAILAGTALDRGDRGKDVAYGWGVVQIHAALRFLLDELGTPWTEPASPWLPYRSLPFLGFDNQRTVPVGNAGGGRLLLGGVLVETDDGGDWLTVLPEADPTGGAPANVLSLDVQVDRQGLSGPACHGATVWLTDLAGNRLDRLRVLVYVQKRAFAGEELAVRTMHPQTGVPGVRGIASACFGYRYFFPAVTSGDWKLQAGQDLDGNGFLCENGDACGWYGGTSEADAAVVEASRTEPVVGLDIVPQLPD